MKKYEFVAQEIRQRIQNGEYAEKLPTESELTALFAVSRVTVRKAIALLQEEYPIRRSKKGGTRIAIPRTDKTNKQVVLIMPNNAIESAEIIMGAEAVFSHSKISLTVKFSNLSEKSERSIIRDLEDLDIAGFLVFPANKVANEDLFFNIMSKGIPLVFIDRYPSRLTCSSVSINNQQTAIEIVDYLVSLGYDDITFFAGELHNQQSTVERLLGYLSAMKKHKLPLTKDSIYSFQDYDELQTCLVKFFENPKTNTAIFCSNDSIAVRFINEAVRRGYRIPADFSVVGIDNRNIVEPKSTVPLTTMGQPYRELGRCAAQIVTEQLLNKSNIIRKVYLPAQLIVRDSTKGQ